MEFTDSSLDMLVWLMAVPSVAWGGFVGPIVPVARTPAGKVCAWTREVNEAETTRVASAVSEA